MVNLAHPFTCQCADQMGTAASIMHQAQSIEVVRRTSHRDEDLIPLVGKICLW